MQNAWTGVAHVFGDAIDTDVIIPGKYTKSLDFNAMKRHTLKEITNDFSGKCKLGDFVVAGHDFGIGSSREQAPLVLKLCGIRCIVAKSFSRIFYRNAINLGLYLVQCNTDGISDGDVLSYDPPTGTLTNQCNGKTYIGQPLPDIMQRILEHGGIVPYIMDLRLEGKDMTLE